MPAIQTSKQTNQKPNINQSQKPTGNHTNNHIIQINPNKKSNNHVKHNPTKQHKYSNQRIKETTNKHNVHNKQINNITNNQPNKLMYKS